MRLRTVKLGDEQVACVALADGRLARIDRVLRGGPSDLLSLVVAEQLDALAVAVAAGVDDDDCVDPDTPVLAPWTRPERFWASGSLRSARRRPRRAGAAYVTRLIHQR
ncbi:MAG: hypothetical protein ACXWEI_03315 [Mycobacterium sp.]